MMLENSALLADLYQFTMMQGYFENKMEDSAIFEFFVRDLPSNRGFLVAAGLEQVVEYLENLRFSHQELVFLFDTGLFSRSFIDFLADFHFTGDVDAMPEGELFFANEPILRVTAPIVQAQFVESRVVNLMHYQTLVASKAARCVLASPNKLLVDFGMRRAHAGEAALFSARASYLAGFNGSSNTLAGCLYGVPVFGTMAHSYIEAHETEIEAIYSFAKSRPHDVILPIDTYDTEAAAKMVVAMASSEKFIRDCLKGVRIDSGDLAMHARRVREILDAGGLEHVKIFVSSNIDEFMIREFSKDGVPIDGFGIGTRVGISADAPYLDCAYILQEYAGIPRWKTSEGKATWPGRKQVYRYYSTAGGMLGDKVTLMDEAPLGRPLLFPVMRNGSRIGKLPSLEQSRELAKRGMASLPEQLKALNTYSYQVEMSHALKSVKKEANSKALNPKS